MRILALELSTMQCSAALDAGTESVFLETWAEESRASRGLFPAITALLNRSGLSLDQVDHFVAGVGPGTFSGLRVAVAALNAFALPGRKPVGGISSPMALAWATAHGLNAEWVTVAGDARRAHYWYARFQIHGNRIEAILPCRIAPADQWPVEAGDSGVLVTADWGRIGPGLLRQAPSAFHVVKESRYPSAAQTLTLARQMLDRGEPLPPPVPVYLHPPVAKPVSVEQGETR